MDADRALPLAAAVWLALGVAFLVVSVDTTSPLAPLLTGRLPWDPPRAPSVSDPGAPPTPPAEVVLRLAPRPADPGARVAEPALLPLAGGGDAPSLAPPVIELHVALPEVPAPPAAPAPLPASEPPPTSLLPPVLPELPPLLPPPTPPEPVRLHVEVESPVAQAEATIEQEVVDADAAVRVATEEVAEVVVDSEPADVRLVVAEEPVLALPEATLSLL